MHALPERFLVIANNHLLSNELKVALTDSNYVLTQIRHSEVQNPPSDAVLSDVTIALVNFCDPSALETVKYLEEMPGCRPLVILFCDHNTVDDLNDAIKAKPKAIISVPFTDAQVLVTIAHLLHDLNATPKIKHVGRMKDDLQNDSTNLQSEVLLLLNDSVFIKQNYKYHKVLLTDICFLKSEGNFTYIQTFKMKFILRMGLQSILDKINYLQIVKVHRSYAVNLKNMDSFNDVQVIIGKHEIPFLKSYRKSFLQRFVDLNG